MIMLKNIQKFCTNCTDKVKADAGIYADDQFLRVTDAQASQQQIKTDLYNQLRSGYWSLFLRCHTCLETETRILLLPRIQLNETENSFR